MKNDEFEKYLQANRTTFDKGILEEIISSKKHAIEERDEEFANYYWKLEHIFVVKSLFINAFHKLKSKKYEDAWNLLDKAEIFIGQLRDNSDDEWLDAFGITFIREMIPEYQKLFPYYLFLSREGIVKKEICSICGKEITIRGGCKHRVGKLYMGEICYAIVIDYEPRLIAIVTNPFDKYAILKFVGQTFDYSIIEKAMEKITNPYKSFAVSKDYVYKIEGMKKHTIEWLNSIERIDYSIEVDDIK